MNRTVTRLGSVSVAMLLASSAALTVVPASAHEIGVSEEPVIPAKPGAKDAEQPVARDPDVPLPSRDVSLGAQLEGGAVLVDGRSQARTKASAASASAVEYRRLPSEFCNFARTGSAGIFVAGTGTGSSPSGCGEIPTTCAEGEVLQQALFRRDTPEDPWVFVEPASCRADLSDAVAQAFARLPLRASVVGVQPPDGWSLVNLPTVVFADGEVQEYSVEVLGAPVVVRATPSEYSWDFGDGLGPLVTADPGQPYPHQTVSRPYAHPGTYTISLTTTWSAQYQADGAAEWLPVTGAATTTTTAPPLTVYEARSHLVDGPLT